MINLPGLSVTVFRNGIGVNFTPSQDPDLCYLVFLEHKYIQQKNPSTPPDYPTPWIQATGWFNPAGRAFLDDRQTSVGPPINIQANMTNNALIADGTPYKLVIGIYSKASGGMQPVGSSQEITFTAPKLYETPPQTAPVNYSPKVTANCDGTLNIEMATRADAVEYEIGISGPGFDSIETVARVPATPGSTLYHYPTAIPITGQVGVTVVPYKADGSTGPIPTSTTLTDGNPDPAVPVYTRGKTYQNGVSATGTPCTTTTTPPTGSTSTGGDTKPTKGQGGGKKNQ